MIFRKHSWAPIVKEVGSQKPGRVVVRLSMCSNILFVVSMPICNYAQKILVNKIERRWISHSPNSIIIRQNIRTRKPILFRFNPFIFKDSIRHDEASHWIVHKPKIYVLFWSSWWNTLFVSFHLSSIKPFCHLVYTLKWKYLSINHRLVQIHPKTSDACLSSDSKWKYTEHSSIFTYGNETIIMMIMCVFFSSSNSVSFHSLHSKYLRCPCLMMNWFYWSLHIELCLW